ncbi:MAG: hypothetical protein MH825_08100 [Cyanobacteria bacterium]|nr:hypothetical protein [Cyanobacteriota bacterium]
MTYSSPTDPNYIALVNSRQMVAGQEVYPTALTPANGITFDGSKLLIDLLLLPGWNKAWCPNIASFLVALLSQIQSITGDSPSPEAFNFRVDKGRQSEVSFNGKTYFENKLTLTLYSQTTAVVSPVSYGNQPDYFVTAKQLADYLTANSMNGYYLGTLINDEYIEHTYAGNQTNGQMIMFGVGAVPVLFPGLSTARGKFTVEVDYYSDAASQRITQITLETQQRHYLQETSSAGSISRVCTDELFRQKFGGRDIAKGEVIISRDVSNMTIRIVCSPMSRFYSIKFTKQS